jgi:hypothetical protein
MPSAENAGPVCVLGGEVDATLVCAFAWTRLLRHDPAVPHECVKGDRLPRAPIDPAFPMPSHLPMRQLDLRKPANARRRNENRTISAITQHIRIPPWPTGAGDVEWHAAAESRE